MQRYLELLSRAFRAALNNAHGKGQLHNSVDPREESEFLTASVLGMFVMLRAAAPKAAIESVSRAAIKHQDTLRPHALSSP